MTYTTVEQSHNLIKWGLDPKTADMRYIKQLKTLEGGVKLPYEYSFKYDKYPVFVDKEEQIHESESLPCWSLEVLWQIMPKVNGEFPQFLKVITKRDNKEGYLVYFEDNEHHKNFNSGVQPTAIEAAIQMIKLLLNYGYLKRV